MQIDDVTQRDLSNTPASPVISQDHIKSANRLSLTNSIVNEIHTVHVLGKEHSPVFRATTMFTLLRERNLFYFTKAFITTTFHI